jgi:hypothetical protein
MEKNARPGEVLFILAAVYGVIAISLYTVSTLMDLIFYIIK